MGGFEESGARVIFQPTRPLRGATDVFAEMLEEEKFQPTRPLRGATGTYTPKSTQIFISTHAPLAGRDRVRPAAPSARRYFNPRAPCGARPTMAARLTDRQKKFQPTRPLRGATLPARRRSMRNRISTHAPLAGRDYLRGETDDPGIKISTHAPLAGRDSKSVQITMHIFAITDKFQMLLHRMPPVRAFCSFLMQENHADFGCEPPK